MSSSRKGSSTKGKSTLRVAEPGEEAPSPTPKTISEAIEHDERSLLVALRAKSAKEIDNGVPPAYLAPVMRQLREIDKAIRLLDAREEQEGPERDGGDNDQDFDVAAI